MKDFGTYEASRYHDISCGHRVVGHEGKCANLHGHNYRIHFVCRPSTKLDTVGRVVDFSVIKTKLCQWLEDHFDHKMLIWTKDPDLRRLAEIDPTVVPVPFNPTAENIAEYLVNITGPLQLAHEPCYLGRVVVEETSKCSAAYTRLEEP